MGKFINLSGKKYGRLTVLRRVDPPNHLKVKTGVYWLCKCECGNETIVNTSQLNFGSIQSCGCLNKEVAQKIGYKNRKYNQYDLSGDIGIIYASNTANKFMFDKQDYNLIKKYCWYENKAHYLLTRINSRKQLLLHRLITNAPSGKCVDHINKNTFDNRRLNLRICKQKENNKNTAIRCDNKSGYIGVNWKKTLNKWVATIACDGHHIYLGCYVNIEDAIKARLQAEKHYFKEYAPQKHLFKKYDI